MITVYLRVLHGNNTFASQTNLASGLCAFPYFADHIAVERMDFRFAAKDCRGKRNIDGRVNIHAFSFKARFLCDFNFQKQISCLTVSAHLTFAS